MRIALWLCFFLMVSSPIFAETIKLKSGQTVQGKITERTDKYIKVDSGIGVSVSYYLDEIENISGVAAVKNPEGQNSDDIRPPVATASHQDVIAKKDSKTFETIYYLGGKEIARAALTGELKGNIPDGLVKIETNDRGDILVLEFKNNKPVDGTTKIYDKDGKLPEGLFLEAGRLTGVYKLVNEQATMEMFYKEGINVGSKFYAANRLIMESVYDPKLNESTVKLFSKGKLSRETKYKGMSSEKIYSRDYDEAGNLISQ